MPLLSEIFADLYETATEEAEPDFDGVRRDYLARLHGHTGRSTILYASAWVQKPEYPEITGINDEDLHALMQVTHGLHGSELDLILHSPGGSPDVAEAIVLYLRQKFSHIRVIVPQLAMSAATMIACAANEIVMGNHSFLGPTDPQIPVDTASGAQYVAAQDVLDQFEQAKKECFDKENRPAWFPILSQYGPALLKECQVAVDRSIELVHSWLSAYMFGEYADPDTLAKNIAGWLADRDKSKSHARHIPREVLTAQGMIVKELESDKTLQDLALSVYHATILAFIGTQAAKIIDNHSGSTYIRSLREED